jgi:transcriptional regulator GlxA family with amidase domain
VPNFPMLAFSAAVKALRVANWVSGRALYKWTWFSEDGKPVSPSSGIAMQPHAAMSEVDRLSIMLLCAGLAEVSIATSRSSLGCACWHATRRFWAVLAPVHMR